MEDNVTLNITSKNPKFNLGVQRVAVYRNIAKLWQGFIYKQPMIDSH